MSVLARAGIGPVHLLTTRDRSTGGPHTIPVVPAEDFIADADRHPVFELTPVPR